MNQDTRACLICGAPLRYSERAEEMACAICGRRFSSNACCENGHFVCDDCHAAPAIAAVRYISMTTASKNPVEIATAMMNSPSVHMHGPEHHILAGAALLAAYRNAGGIAAFSGADDEMIRRGSMVPGGFCGMAGACGAALSAGIFYALITKTTPLSTDSWREANLLTAAALTAVGNHGGPRCCKRDTYLAILTAVPYVSGHIGVVMELPEKIECTFSAKNRECLLGRCPFFNGHPV